MPLVRLRCGHDIKLEIEIQSRTLDPSYTGGKKELAQKTVQQFLGTLVMYGSASAEDATRVNAILQRSFGMNVTTSSVQLTFHDQ